MQRIKEGRVSCNYSFTLLETNFFGFGAIENSSATTVACNLPLPVYGGGGTVLLVVHCGRYWFSNLYGVTSTHCA